MQGILARGEHRFAAVDSAAQGWSFLRRNPGTDLVFTGLRLEGRGNGLALVQNLRGNSVLKHLPVVVYTGHADRMSVRNALALHVQNFLSKPYHDDDIFAEIIKAAAAPWRNNCFAPELGDSARDERKPLLTELNHVLERAREPLCRAAELTDFLPVADVVAPLRRLADAAGATVVDEALARISKLAGEGKWDLWPAAIEAFDLAALIVADRLGDERAVPDFYTPREISAGAEVAERAEWLAAPAANRCPVIRWEQLQREIDALTSCPVIDSAASAFQMIANGQPSSLNSLMDLVARDPGLSAMMLIAANRAHPPKEQDTDRIEDARLAVGQLGEVRLQAIAGSMAITEERIMDLPPEFCWPQFWTFQRGVARLAQFTCRELEFYSLEPVARTAGQLHDLGKLILAHLHPAGFQAILEHTRVHHVPLPVAENLFLGCTSRQIATYFADRFGLSRRLANVMRWIDDPAVATEDVNLVAIISLARDLCHRNRVGASGDILREAPGPIEETAEWQILRQSLYPGFNLKKFEAAVQVHCALLRTELSGQAAGTVGEIASHASV